MNISEIGQKLTSKMMNPGFAFWLPVQFTQAYPTTFVKREEPVCDPQMARLIEGNVWYDEATGRYQIGSERQEITIGARIRPFLILKCVKIRDVIFHEDAILGLPIKSIKDYMRKKQFMVSLMNRQIPHMHLLSKKYYQTNGLPKESYVCLSQPVLINAKHFTHYCCLLRKTDFNEIVGRFRSFVKN